MATVRDLLRSDALFKFVINNTLSDEWKVGAVSTIMVVCLALQALIEDQVDKLNKIEIGRTATGIGEKMVKNRKVQDCV